MHIFMVRLFNIRINIQLVQNKLLIVIRFIRGTGYRKEQV